MQNQKALSWFFYLCALEGAVALTALLLIPSEGGRLSLARLALTAILLAACLLCAYLGIRPVVGLHKFARPQSAAFAALLGLTFGLLLFLLRYLDPDRFLSTYERLSPLLWYFFILSTQISILLLYWYQGLQTVNLLSNKPIYLAALVALCVLLLIFVLISRTGLGLTPDPAYWGEPGVPMLGWQFAAALSAGLCVFCIAFFMRARALDTFLPFSIFLFAVGLWLSVPASVLANSFYMPIGPPAFQPFPYSDAAYYDQMAHSLLIGHPYMGEIPTRPLYISLLTILHFLFGEDYRRIIMGQTLVLAFIPIVLYSLGRKLHSRAAGLTIAVFFIFRELTTLLVSSDTRVSNTKTLLVDLPTLLLLLLACLFVFRWLESKSQRDALIAGGMFGLLLLLRTQSVLLLPFVVLVALFTLGWKNKSLYILISVFLLALVVTVLPWLTHNYLQTGQFTFDAPFQYKIIATQYSYSGNLDIYNYDFEGKGLGQVLLEFAVRDPRFVFGFIANHFLAAQVGGLLALPLIKSYNGIFEPVNLYWMDWNGSLEPYNILLVLTYLAVISLGLGAAWWRWRWVGLLPLAFSIGYALATAIGRFSGWRYDLPADWIWYFYFGIGFAEILRQAAQVFGVRAEPGAAGSRPDAPPVKPLSFGHGFSLLLMFILISALPWLLKSSAAPRYAEQSPSALETRIASISEAPAPDEIQTFASQPEAVMEAGRVLYPRSFSRDRGIASANPWPAYAVRDYPRLGFLLLNQSATSAVFPGRINLMPFPHGADAIVLGCRRDDYVEVRLIAFPELDSVYLSAPLTETCPS